TLSFLEKNLKTAIPLPGKSFHEFGPFHLDPSLPVLLRSGSVVPLAPKTLEVLVVLVDRRGTIVSKDQLVSAVWPDTFVEEGNLAHHISLLRKTLGDFDGQPYIETISKRGYRFNGPVRQAAEDGDSSDNDAKLLHLETGAPPDVGAKSAEAPAEDVTVASASLTRKPVWPLRWVSAGLLLGFAVACAVGWLVVRNRSAPSIIAQFTESLPPGEVLGATPGQASSAVLSPDGTRLVYVGSRGGQS